MTNHPVHILDENGNLSPTALIPFCQIGENFIGVGNKRFNVKVCNSFKAKIIKDQLCYTFDPSKVQTIKDKEEISVTLYINYNEDRQLSTYKMATTNEKKVFVESIGKLNLYLIKARVLGFHYCFTLLL